MIQAIVFDLDDTLYPEREFVVSGFQAVDDWLRREKAVTGFFEHAFAAYSAGRRGDIFDAALNRCGVTYDAADMQRLVQLYRTHPPRIQLHPDARWAIEHFRDTKKLGIITDGYLAAQKSKVHALGLSNDFAAIVYSDELGRQYWKPSLVPYRKFIEAVPCDPRECVYVGDNPRKDFLGANQLGWLSVQVCRPDGEYRGIEVESSYRPQMKISSLTELADVLE
ncbi:MAG: HAD family hydrolase [Verrucomicrobia bacterium]|nr:HAD family hydrolase [Verrucomicrobiota bacterium]